MNDCLKDKVEKEFQTFYLDQMRSSRDGIFSKSEEIEMKKKLHRVLLDALGETDEMTSLALSWQENLLESAYRFCEDHNELSLPDRVAAWIRFVVDGTFSGVKSE